MEHPTGNAGSAQHSRCQRKIDTAGGLAPGGPLKASTVWHTGQLSPFLYFLILTPVPSGFQNKFMSAVVLTG